MIKKILYIVIVTLIFTACFNQDSSIKNLESNNWIVTHGNSKDRFLNTGDTLVFNSKELICKVGYNNQFTFYTNDSLLLINVTNQQRIFQINMDYPKLVLTELYSSEQSIYELHAISN